MVARVLYGENLTQLQTRSLLRFIPSSALDLQEGRHDFTQVSLEFGGGAYTIESALEYGGEILDVGRVGPLELPGAHSSFPGPRSMILQ